jgi:uncharacterized protein YggT (Ycf19 family)
MLLYSIYSFGVTLVIFLLWVLFLSALKSNAPETDSLRQLLRLHLGRIESWPRGVKLLLPLIATTPVWWLASWPLTHWDILPGATTLLQRTQQSFLVGVGSYLAWKHLIVGVLGLYFVSSYIFFGKQPFWQHLDLVARQLMVPLRLLPLRLGKIDLTPLVGSMMTVSGFKMPRSSASSIMESPMRSFTLPSGLKNSHLSRMVAGRPAVTLLRRTSGVRPIVSTILL